MNLINGGTLVLLDYVDKGENMKKALAILMTVCLLASLFVACDNNARIDELVKASFDASESRALIVSNDPFIAFNDSSIKWQYKAVKDTDKAYNVGAAATWTDIPGTTSGLLSNTIEFSQGKWNFELRAVKTADEDVVVYYGKTDDPVLLTKQTGGEKFNILINLTAQLSGQKGYIVLSNISVKHMSSGTDTLDAPSKVVIDAGTANEKVLTLGTDYSTTGISISTLGEGYEIPVGTHTVKVQKIGVNNEILAEEEKTIEVYAGLKTTISNWVLEITQTGQFAPVAPTGSTSGNVSSATDGNLKLTVENVTPSMVSGNDTTVTVPTAVLGQETTATVSVAVKQASEASVDNSFTASSGNAVAAVIDLTLSVGTTPKTEFSSPIKVETYVAKNLSGFQFSYPGETGWNKVDNKDDVDQAKEYWYDSSTGELVFITSHFSSFVVESSSVAVIGDTAYSTFSEALSHASDGDTIVLINNINIDYVTGDCCISIEDKNITIDGSGKTISLEASSPISKYGILITGSDSSKTVTIKNAKINTTKIERAVVVSGNIGVVIDSCTISTNGVGINVRGANVSKINNTNISVNYNGDFDAHKITGILVSGADARVTVNGSTINAVNNSKTEKPSDAGDSSWTHSWCKGLYIGTSGYDAKLTVNETTVNADFSIIIDGTSNENRPGTIEINSGEYEGYIGSTGYSYKTVIINGGTFTGIDNFGSFYGKNDSIAKLVISGGTFNVEPGLKFIADGYYAEQNGDGNYEVKIATDWIQIANTSWYEGHENDKSYSIETPEQLAGLAKLVNYGTHFSGKTVELTKNIDLSGLKWTPIGNSSKAFKGTFDGGNHTISNLYINSPSTCDVGLFGFTTDGEVKNLTVNNAEIKGYLDVGVVAGTPYTSEYSNIKVTGSVKVDGYAYVGGAFGKNLYANATDITVDCSDDSYVRADSKEYRTYVGGIVGFMGEGAITVKNANSNINVYGSTCDVGGITGIAHYNNTFINCSSSGDVSITSYNDEGDQLEIGGIAGVWHNQNGTSVTFKNCSFTGNISAMHSNGTPYNGPFANNGLVGKQYSSTGTGVLNITQ